MGESLYSYIIRIKLERSAAQLLYSSNKPITDIALDYGFADSAMFARSFKKYYGISATEYKRKHSKISKAKSKISKENNANLEYNHEENMINRRHNKMQSKCDVEVVSVDKMTVAYLRHVGTYEELGKVFGSMIARLGSWAGAQRIMDKDTKVLAVYHDNPNITEESKLKTSICITIPKDTKVDGDLGKMSLSSGKYAIGHFEIDDDKAQEQHGCAWQYMYGEWLPQSGYQPDDSPVFEVYVNDPNTHPERKHFVDIYLPVKPF